ncbi:acyltransferase family protein [Methylobacterium sp. NPDC080182]|uniref:acyltransferase family protein n=1 Tax=Methylobacterium sp. NPDC080182 TaxID=3390590 RepID=UPI003CFBEF6F
MSTTPASALDASHPAIATGRSERLVAFDHMRGFVVALVVLHHATLAYCTFGHINRVNYALSTAPVVDPRRWIGFDLLVRLNDGFFMPLLFLLSGLFVWDGLRRRGARAFLGARMRRLGLPFVIGVLILSPLAYFPAFLQAGGTLGFGSFWIATVTCGPWLSGPPWFIGILLVFDAAAALIFTLAPRLAVPPLVSSLARRPVSGFVLLLACSLLLFLPLLVAVGPTRWFALGPLAIQGSRIGLYAAYFTAGVALGHGGMQAVVQFARAMASQWAAWGLLAAATGAVFMAVAAIARGELFLPPAGALAVVGIAQAAFCAAACFALPALFLRFGGGSLPAWDSLAANSFAIYLLHYPYVTWTQYGLLPVSVDAAVKGALVFTIALAASWASAAFLRRLPMFGRML